MQCKPVYRDSEYLKMADLLAVLFHICWSTYSTTEKHNILYYLASYCSGDYRGARALIGRELR